MRELDINSTTYPGHEFRNVPGYGRRKVLNRNSPIVSPTLYVDMHGSLIQNPADRWMIDPADLGVVVTATSQLIDTAVLQMNSPNAREARKFWFGDTCGTEGHADNLRVLTELRQLQTRKNAIAAVLFSCCGGPNYAQSIMAAPRGGRSNSLPCTVPRLLLGALSRQGAAVRAGLVTIGMCIATVLHEYTHIFLNTDDVDFSNATGPGQPKAYGAVDARGLAEAGPNSAIFQDNGINQTQGRAGNQASAVSNAENWCFYLTEPLHRAGVGAVAAINWTGTNRPTGSHPPRPLTPHGAPPLPTTPHGPPPGLNA